MREKESVTRIIYVRHGETDFPVDRIYCDDVEDPKLNETGLAQARSAAQILAEYKLDHVYVSPMARTQGTACALLSFHPQAGMSIEPALRERRFGEWDGLTFSEIENGYPEQFKLWKRDQAGFMPQGGESIFDVQHRIDAFVEGLIERHKGGVVAVVAHVGPIRVAVARALGLPMERYRQIQVDPASISVVDYGRRQNNLMLLNFSQRFWSGAASEAGTY